MQTYKVYINNKPKIITENWEIFCSDYIIVEAAGGIVYNHKNQILMIFRDGKWDLPKGKIEGKEEKEVCAIREVEEECGVSSLEILQYMKETYHTYKLNGENILKRIYWYKMTTSFNGKLTPQTQEGITIARWVNKKDILKKINSSYGNIKELLLLNYE